MLSNQTSTQNKMFDKMATSLSKSSTQAAYTALSVFWKQDHLVMVRFWPFLLSSKHNHDDFNFYQKQEKIFMKKT